MIGDLSMELDFSVKEGEWPWVVFSILLSRHDLENEPKPCRNSKVCLNTGWVGRSKKFVPNVFNSDDWPEERFPCAKCRKAINSIFNHDNGIEIQIL